MEVTIRDVVRRNARQCSERIRAIKDSCIERGTYINPKEKSWKTYTGLKFECSKWLSCLCFLDLRDTVSGVSLREAPRKLPMREHIPNGYSMMSWSNNVVLQTLHKLTLEFKDGVPTKYKINEDVRVK